MEAAFAQKVKMIPALAFIPVDEVVNRFEIVIDNPEYRDNDDLILYFEEKIGS